MIDLIKRCGYQKEIGQSGRAIWMFLVGAVFFFSLGIQLCGHGHPRNCDRGDKPPPTQQLFWCSPGSLLPWCHRSWEHAGGISVQRLSQNTEIVLHETVLYCRSYYTYLMLKNQDTSLWIRQRNLKRNKDNKVSMILDYDVQSFFLSGVRLQK